jgi:hypothetical protein
MAARPVLPQAGYNASVVVPFPADVVAFVVRLTQFYLYGVQPGRLDRTVS